MANIFNIVALVVEPVGVRPQVVTAIHWRRESGGVSEYGVSSIPAPQAAAFIPFDQLKTTDAVGWVETALGPQRVAEIDANIAGVAAAKLSPKVQLKTDTLK